MAFKAGEGEFQIKPPKKEHQSLAPEQEIPKVRGKFIDDIPKGVQELIDAGDHLAEITKRMQAGMLAPERTVNRALESWDAAAVGFEDE